MVADKNQLTEIRTPTYLRKPVQHNDRHMVFETLNVFIFIEDFWSEEIAGVVSSRC